MTTILRTVLLDGNLFFAPFVNKNAWFKKEGEAMKVTKETKVFTFDGETMVETKWEEVSAQK